MARSHDSISEPTAHPEGSVNALIAAVGKRVRTRRGELALTLDQLATRSGVSRRMITLLESGSANASIATLDKLARALTVGFPTLVAPPTLALSEPAATTQLTAIWEDDLGSMAQLLLAGGRDRLVDLWQWRLMPKSFYCATPDPSGSEEFVLSLSGTLTVVVESDTLVVKEGQLVRFASDVAYSYENRGVEPVEFIRAVLVPR